MDKFLINLVKRHWSIPFADSSKCTYQYWAECSEEAMCSNWCPLLPALFCCCHDYWHLCVLIAGVYPSGLACGQFWVPECVRSAQESVRAYLLPTRNKWGRAAWGSNQDRQGGTWRKGQRKHWERKRGLLRGSFPLFKCTYYCEILRFSLSK